MSTPSHQLHPVTDLVLAGIVAAMLLATPGSTPAPGLVKPDFTPVHLAQQATNIAVLALKPAVDGKVAFTPGRVLKGAAPAAGVLDISELGQEEQALFTVQGPAVWLTGISDGRAGGTPPVAMLQLGREEHWYAVIKTDTGYRLDRDPFDLSGVWAGGCDMLERVLAYCIADPKAEVPVNSGANWEKDFTLGEVKGAVAGSLTLELPGIGPCVYLAAASGDRLFRSSPDGKSADATEAAGISGASLLVATGDVTGDGKVDVVRWDGKALTQLEPAAGAKPSVIAGAPAEARAIACLDAGAAPRAAIAVFTAAAPVLLVPDGSGTYARRELLPPPAGLEAAFAGTACDLDGDGKPDLVQAFAKGLAVWQGQGAGAFAAPTIAWSGTMAGIHTLITTDGDGDGRLDLVVAGSAKEHTLLLNKGGLQLTDRLEDTGELRYHAPNNGSLAGMQWDVNLDGRPDVLLFPGDEGPKSYYNRGFACFGLGRELLCNGQSPLPGLIALADGVSGGGSIDLNGDGQPDLVAVTKAGVVWGVTLKPDNAGRMAVTVALPAGMPGPVMVTATDGTRSLGARSVGHGCPAIFGKTSKGPLSLTWTDTAGKPHSVRPLVIKSMRIELTP